MQFLISQAGCLLPRRMGQCVPTFSSPVTMELIIRQLEVEGGACAQDIGIHFLVIRKSVDLFTKWDSSCNPACCVLILRR